MRAIWLLSLVIGWIPRALADFTGRVVKVTDGDSLTLLINKKQIKVRLYAIDAPERSQGFWKRSRQSLAQMCAATQAHILDRGKDRWGRTIGRVHCAGIDANSEQLRRERDRPIKRTVQIAAISCSLIGYLFTAFKRSG